MRTLTCLAAVWAGIGLSQVAAADLLIPEGTWDFNAFAMGEPPVSGHHAPGVELLDAIMLKCLREIGCSGATLTVARGGHTLYSRGYGWSDRGRKVPIYPDIPMSTGSCDKPLTFAMIRQLAAHGKLDLNASA
jgi:CubicO group peptidase (beta-lactamase class C family)